MQENVKRITDLVDLLHLSWDDQNEIVCYIEKKMAGMLTPKDTPVSTKRITKFGGYATNKEREYREYEETRLLAERQSIDLFNEQLDYERRQEFYNL